MAPVTPSGAASEEVTAAAPVADSASASASARGIAWSPCVEDPELLCGTLSVPMDYQRPRGPRLSLAVIKAPALSAPRKGSVFVNPGGPGGSGVDLVIYAKQLFAGLRDNFDIVSFDPRGTSRSRPVACQVPVPAAPTSGSLEALAAYEDELGRRVAQSCLEQNGPLASLVGTNNVARDLDAFRAALGESRINYLGYSYGTILGASYATLFPQRVRGMVLDGNVPPQWLGDYLLELDSEGSAGAEAALRRLDQLCSADPQCVLHEQGVIAVFDRVVARLDRSPVVVDGGIIDGATVRQTLFGGLYSEALWPRIVEVLAAADAGIYDIFPPAPAEPPSTLEIPAGLATVCDDTRSRRFGLDYLPTQLAFKELYPRFGGANFGEGLAACSAWPETEVAPLLNATTSNPIVLIGNDFDPATPMSWSRNMAAVLRPRARLVRYRGGGHTIYGSGSACIDDAVNTYFRDLIAPPRGLSCPAVPRSFAHSAHVRSGKTMAEVLSEVAPHQRPLHPQKAKGLHL